MPKDTPNKNDIIINYIKAQTFREVSCDGVVGGTTPRGKLWCGFFTERYALPRIVTYPVNPSGIEDTYELDEGERRVIEAKEGVVRNIEFGVYLSIEEAEKLRNWLSQEIDKAKLV